jgi:glyoxylase-like metal-dependent hydrolase (beta-lactamase superfamily II)
MAWSTSVIIPPDGNMADYLSSLQLMLGRKDSRYWPTHGPPLNAPRNYVEILIAHRKQRMVGILRLLENGPLRITQMVEPLYPGLDPRLTGGAKRSIFASLLYLIDTGEVQPSGHPTLNSIYHRAC